MPTASDKKRWRPRFSLRTLLILVTLGCAYLACWGPTRTRGVPDVFRFATNQLPEEPRKVALEHQDAFVDALGMSAEAPLIVGMDVFLDSGPEQRHYFFWFFGYVVKLPFVLRAPATGL